MEIFIYSSLYLFVCSMDVIVSGCLRFVSVFKLSRLIYINIHIIHMYIRCTVLLAVVGPTTIGWPWQSSAGM